MKDLHLDSSFDGTARFHRYPDNYPLHKLSEIINHGTDQLDLLEAFVADIANKNDGDTTLYEHCSMVRVQIEQEHYIDPLCKVWNLLQGLREPYSFDTTRSDT